MAKKKILNYVFEPGISKDANLFPNAVNLLEQNKDFLQAMVVAFINNQIANNIAPYVGYTYASQKCIRDIGLIIDAIIHDLRYGGNVKIRQVADYFHIDGEPMIRGDVSPETTGQAYLRDLINNFIFTNTPVPQLYGQTAVPQVLDSSLAEAGAATRNTVLWNIVSSVITNGPAAMPSKIPGVSSIRLIGNYQHSEVLLITDTTASNILYNFADPANSMTIEYKRGRSSGDNELLSDLDYPAWWKTSDTITSIYLSTDTSTLDSTADLQIFVEEPYTTIKPWDFGTDAIERMRVASPQAMLDADFEYGLQPTKWQAIGQIRGYPSLYELPGTDLTVTAITTDASQSIGGVGSSFITVTTSGAHGLTLGQPITIKGLLATVNGFARAEGSFLVSRIDSSNTFGYFASARVGTTPGQSLLTSYVQLRQANYYTGSSIGRPTFTVTTNGSADIATVSLNVSTGSFNIPYTGNTPSIGEPVFGAAALATGTVVAGTVGTGAVTANLAESTLNTDTSITLVTAVGVQQNLALNNGTGGAIFVNSIVGPVVNLSNPIGQILNGSNGTNPGVAGTVIESIGTSALWNVDIDGGAYTVNDAGDSSANGENYFVGDQIRIAGTDLGGASPANDIIISITGVDSGGSITSFAFTGSGTGTGSYTSVSGTNELMTGSTAAFTVVRNSGVYSVSVISNGGSGYRLGNRISISGLILGGSAPANNCTITVTGESAGAVTSVTADGIPYAGDTITFFPVINISEPLTNTLTSGTVINLGAIAEIEVNFDSNHGLVPGTPAFNYITSQPTPTVTSTAAATGLPTGAGGGQTWTGVAFGNSTFVAVRTGTNESARSTDGINWTAGGGLPASASWTSVAFGTIGGSNIFVAIASGGTQAAYSTNDGSTWITATLPSSGSWTSVTFFDGRFVAIRGGSTATAISTNGITWVAGGALTASTTWTDVVGGIIGTSTYFVAVASGGTTANYSVDGGASWAATGVLPASSTWNSITYGNNSFLAVARTSPTAAISTNGIVWTSVTLPTSDDWNHVTYGRENFVIFSDTSNNILLSFTGTTGSWTQTTGGGSGGWEETAWGAFNTDPNGVYISVGTTRNVQRTVLTSANHQLAAGPFVITSVPSLTSLRYAARAQGFITTTEPLTGTMFVRPDAFFVHRPFDGGVQLGTGGPAHGAQAIRQSKKYIRYQSGKGMFYNTGALFAPSYNLASATANNTSINSLITFTTDDNDHGLQPGATVEVQGMVSFEYNGEYTVENIIDARKFTARSQVVLSTLTAELGVDCKVVLKRWHGSTVKVGTFDEQNGIFYQYDGQRMAVVKRSSTNQLTGVISINVDSNTVNGTGTRFLEQLLVGDKIVIRGMTHTVTSISTNAVMTVNPDWRGTNNVVGVKIAKTEDDVYYQENWNLDKLDGTGPSGYALLPWKMQMIAIQYTWYAVGFIEFHLRGADGKFIFFHRIRNSNVNTEAYMRTANLPVRYEVENISAKNKLKATINSTATALTLYDAYAFPTSGTVYIDNELITYSGKSGNNLINLTRAATMSAFAAGQNRTFTAGNAASHTANSAVILVSNTASPAISHWGSAIITDGNFDTDRGYLFSYTSYGISTSGNKQTAFMLRLAPSVSNAIVGDLGERELLNRAQLLLSSIAISVDATASAGAIIVEGILNPRNYPSNPANIIWNSLNSQGAGGQPSFCQVALGGSINWGGTPLTTTTATVSGQVTLNVTAQAFGSVTQNITAIAQPSPLYSYTRAFDTNRNFFVITNAAFDTITATPLRVGDRISVVGIVTGGQTITNIQRAISGSAFTQITMSANANAASPIGVNQTVTITNSQATLFANAFSTARNTFVMTNTEVTSSNITVGDSITQASFLIGGRSVSSITRNAFRISNVEYDIITMNANASATSAAASGQTTTLAIPQTASAYAATNFVFFTQSTWNSSNAGVATRVSSSYANFPAGTAVSAVATRTLGSTTVVRVTFTQSNVTTINAAGTVTFEFGDVQFAQPGEQVFAFVANPGNTVDLNLEQLKELTTTAIGGRGAFPNGPDVLAINVLKVAGTATNSTIILRWGEAQA